MADQPTDYSIEALLSKGVQPFDDLPEQDLREWFRGISKASLADPVSITSDGILIDGHQRLKAMLSQGRKRIDAADVHVVQQATAENALDWSIRLNANKRPIPGAQKAELARHFQRTRRWSLGRIATAFGVSRPAVSQWMANYPAPDGEQPTFVIGEDGKEYDVADRQTTERAPRHPWAPDGHAYKAVRKATRALQGETAVAGLNPIQLAKLGQEVDRLIEAAEELRTAIEGNS